MLFILGLLVGSLLAVTLFGAGFWFGYAFLKRQIPTLPLPEVKVENHNHIEVPSKPVIEPRRPIDVQRDSTAEFIEGL